MTPKRIFSAGFAGFGHRTELLFAMAVTPKARQEHPRAGAKPISLAGALQSLSHSTIPARNSWQLMPEQAGSDSASNTSFTTDNTIPAMALPRLC